MALRYARLVFLFLLMVIVSAPTSAQSFLGPSATPKNQAVAYANTSEGLQSLVEDILRAAKSKDNAKEAELIRGLVMPEESKWFSEEFGPGFGASLSAAYRRLQPNLEHDLQVIFENDVQRGWMKPKVLRYADAASTESPIDKFLNCMEEVVPLYQTAVNGDRTTYGFTRDSSQMGKITVGDPHGYFVFVQGGFRFIPQEVLMMLPKERPVRIKLDMDVMNSKIINRAPIPFSTEAMRKHIGGKVVVELILDMQGNIKESKVLEGDPILSGPVLETVKKWKFEPTRLDGDPVEVDFEISFVYQVR